MKRKNTAINRLRKKEYLNDLYEEENKCSIVPQELHNSVLKKEKNAWL